MTRFWKYTVANAMILFALGIALSAFIGYVGDYKVLQNWGDGTDMAVNTSVCLMLITTALILRTHKFKQDAKYDKA